MRPLALSGLLLAIACARPEQTPPTNDSGRAVVVAPESALTVRADTPASPRASPTPVAAPAASPAKPVFDTVRGLVRRVGADPNTRLILKPIASGSAPIALAGPLLAELVAAEGLEVMVSGTRSAERAMDASPAGAVIFQVNHFAVRAAEGMEAHDGILVSRDGRVYLETAPDQRTAVVALPAALQDQMGARVFLVGPLTRAPQAFGILRPR